MIQRHEVSRVALCVFATLFLLCPAAGAQSNEAASGVYRTGDGPMAVVNKELEQAAVVHRVRIRTGEGVFGGTPQGTISVVALAGIEKYRATDFARGVPIQLVIIKSAGKDPVPNGSYVVKAQFKPGATAGTASYTSSAGVVVARQPLLVRTWAQAAVMFPNEFSDPQPVDIPVVSSVNVVDKNGHWHSIDCTGPGWNWVVIYF